VTALELPAVGGLAGAAVARAIGFFVVWILIAGADPSDLPAGVIATLLATWVSLVLQPAGTQRIRFTPLIRFGLRLLFESLLAGLDVARRALDLRLPLNPGVIRYEADLPPGSACAAFCTVMSLVPGTLPIGSAGDGALLVHCLDLAQPIAANLARDEAALRRALGREQADG
jgi:multicomponent Na+:H+ antiporter subunit E